MSQHANLLLQEHVSWMFRTVYVLLRDTGRRPQEVCGLRLHCLDTTGGYTLVWDNRKSGRYRRRLPITAGTAEVIEDWLRVRTELCVEPRSEEYLFPARSAVARLPFLSSGVVSTVLRRWVAALPALHSDVAGPDGDPIPFDRGLIFPYAFRHTYAQRHADAGVPIDVLKDLLDHQSIDTTMGYYTVSEKRKRQAVEMLRLQVVDRTGNPSPVLSATEYQLRSVAVPYGNCIEPSNVKAGGHACPVRFQCSGCGFYRPDPSHLPAIDEQINALRADRETAQAMGTADFVIRNLTEQIDAFVKVKEAMQEALTRLDNADRASIEDACSVLRRARAGNRPLIPITPVATRPL